MILLVAAISALAETPPEKPAGTCVTPLALMGQLEALRTEASQTIALQRETAPYFQPGALFREPLIHSLYEESQKQVSQVRKEASHWKLRDGHTNKSLWDSLAEYYDKPSWKSFRYLRQLFDDMADYLGIEPPYVVSDAKRNSQSHPYGMNDGPEVIGLHFLRSLKDIFPESLASKSLSSDPKEQLDQFKQLNQIIGPRGWSEADYYRVAPLVHQFLKEMAESQERRHALPTVLGEHVAAVRALTEAQNYAAAAESNLKQAIFEFEKDDPGFMSNFEWRKNRRAKSVGPAEESVRATKAGLAQAEINLKQFYDGVQLKGLTALPHEAAPIVNPELSALALSHVSPKTNHETEGLSPRFAAARKEINDLDAIVARYFADGGLFGLSSVKANKGKLEPQGYLELMRQILTPPPIEETKPGAYHAEQALREWNGYLKGIGVTEAQYLRLLSDLRELENHPVETERILHRLVPEWHTDFKELNLLREAAFAKAPKENPTLATTSAVPAESLIPRSPPPPLLSTRESIAHYLDSVNTWGGEFDGVAQTALQGRYAKLATESKTISDEVSKATRKGRPVDPVALRKRLLPLITEVGKELDAELPKLERLHSEGLMIQHGLTSHVKGLRELVAQRRTVILAENEKLPEWQQDINLRQLEREEMRLKTLETLKTGFDSTIKRSTQVEQSVEAMRDQITQLSVFLNAQVGDPSALRLEKADALLKLLAGYHASPAAR